MSQSRLVFVRRVVYDENIDYTITFLIDYPATVLRLFQRGCLFKSDMSAGDLASSCGGRLCVLLCFIDPRVRKIRNEASRCSGIFSSTPRFYYVASSPGSPLPHFLNGHRKLVGSSAIPARSCPGPVQCQ